jgi:hypothetical protein
VSLADIVNVVAKNRIESNLTNVFLCILRQFKGVLKIGAKIQLIPKKKKLFSFFFYSWFCEGFLFL